MLEEVDPADEARSYRQSSFPRRVLVASAGSAVHMVLALALFWSLFVFVGESVPTAPTVAGMLHFAKGETPAELGGVRAGDVFVSIDGHPVTSIDGLSNVDLGERGAGPSRRRPPGRPDRESDTQARRRAGTSRRSTTAAGSATRAGTRPGSSGSFSRAPEPRPSGRWRPSRRQARSSVLSSSPRAGGSGRSSRLHGLSGFFHQVATAGQPRARPPGRAGRPPRGAPDRSSGQIISFLGAIQIGAQAYKQDIGELLLLLAAINLFVGIVNMFPMLPLDGGHVAIAVYERIRSRRGGATTPTSPS